jgi:hypothetical protein
MVFNLSQMNLIRIPISYLLCIHINLCRYLKQTKDHFAAGQQADVPLSVYV